MPSFLYLLKFKMKASNGKAFTSVVTSCMIGEWNRRKKSGVEEGRGNGEHCSFLKKAENERRNYKPCVILLFANNKKFAS